MESGQYQDATGRLPDWWDKRPPSFRGDDFYLRAFWELSSCRQFGMTVGPIPWHRILAYGAWKRLDRGMLEVFIRVIREMDEVYLKHLNEDQQARSRESKRRTRRT